MSNALRREDLRGAIIQGGKIVGGVDLPEPRQPFIDQFAREYARLGLTVVPVDQLSATHQIAANRR